MNRTRKNDINKYTYGGNVYNRREKCIDDATRECRARGARVLVMRARCGALVTPVQVQVVSVSRERVERSMNEVSNVFNPLPFSFINSKARVKPNCIGIITDIGSYFRVRPTDRSHIIISRPHEWAPRTSVKINKIKFNFVVKKILLYNQYILLNRHKILLI